MADIKTDIPVIDTKPNYIATHIPRVGESVVPPRPRVAGETPGADSPVMKTLSEVTNLPENDPRRQEADQKVEKALEKNMDKPYDEIPVGKVVRPFTTKTTR